MHLSDHSLRQIDDAYVRSLDPEALRGLSLRLLADLKDARDRLNQGPENSSRPPTRRAPWERRGGGRESDAEADADAADSDLKAKPAEANPAEAKPARKAGKQPGAPGVGRTQVFQAHEEQPHYPNACAGCSRPRARAGAVAYSGFQAVDLRWDDPARPGLTVWGVDHRYYEAPCACGHRTRAVAGHGGVDPLLAGIALGEWRLVGPGLAALLVALAYRFRLSRARIQEFLGEWLGLNLSIGAIHQTVHEAAAAVAPAEEELVRAVLASDLLHADETAWPEHGQPLWLWVFVAATAILYYAAGRGKELVENVLDGFSGWLMSDGWIGLPRLPAPVALLGAPDPQGAGLGRELRPRSPRLWPACPGHLGGVDGGGPRRPRSSVSGGTADSARTVVGRLARRLRRAPEQPASENPRLGGGVAQRLGGHLPGLAPSRAPADQQRGGAGAAALGDRPQDQSRHPHRHRLAGLRPARQRHRHLPATRPLALALPCSGHRRPARRPPSRTPAAARGVNDYLLFSILDSVVTRY